jgi:pimeloyl-ACP methyl ester carboxylesterase
MRRLFVISLAVSAPVFGQSFVLTGSLNQVRYVNTATLLQNGMVLVTGGQPGSPGDPINTAELYNSTAGTWQYTTSPMNVARSTSAAALMNDGRVLIIGGATDSGALSSVEIFDPTTGTFTFTGSLNQARYFPGDPAAITLLDGRVLAIGGDCPGCPDGNPTSTVEAYDPQQGTWSYVAPLSQGNSNGYTSTLLLNGSVLIAGGCYTDSCPPATAAVELFDPTTNTWQQMTPLLLDRAYHTATLLPDGAVLIAGGIPTTFVTTNTTEVYDPSVAPNGLSQWGPLLNVARRDHAAALNPDGSVLVAGGIGDQPAPYSSAELLTNTTSAWTMLNPMNIARYEPTATVLPSGAVLIATGAGCCLANGYSGAILAAELWVSPTTSGTISVTTNLASGTFTITGPTTYTGSGTSATFSAPPGQYTIIFGAAAGYDTPAQQTQTLAVGATITFTGSYTSLPTLSVKPQSLEFTYQAGFVGPIPAQGITISTGKQPVSFYVSVSTGSPWLTVTPQSGTTNTTVSVFVGADQAAGTYQGQITITATGTQNSPQTVPVTLIVTGPNSPIVLLVPGIFGSKLASSSEVVWLSDKVMIGPFYKGNLAQLEYDINGNPKASLSTSATTPTGDYGGLFNINSDPTNSAYDLDCSIGWVTIFSDYAACLYNINVYNSLYYLLLNQGYAAFTFPYDWRMDISTLAAQLANTVSSLAASYPNHKIAIVAHSMGGLLVGEMLRTQGTQLAPVLGPIVTLGTPFGGSVDTYLYAQGWASPFPSKLINPAHLKTYGSNWTSGYELLPRNDFVQIDEVPVDFHAIYTGTFDPNKFPALSRANATTNNPLTLAYSLWQASESIPVYPEAYAIIGSGQLTPTTVTEDPAQNNCPIYLTNNGDGTVPLASAQASTWISSTTPNNIRYAKTDHVGLPQNGSVQAGILNVLAGKSIDAHGLKTSEYSSSTGQSGCLAP